VAYAKKFTNPQITVGKTARSKKPVVVVKSGGYSYYCYDESGRKALTKIQGVKGVLSCQIEKKGQYYHIVKVLDFTPAQPQKAQTAPRTSQPSVQTPPPSTPSQATNVRLSQDDIRRLSISSIDSAVHLVCNFYRDNTANALKNAVGKVKEVAQSLTSFAIEQIAGLTSKKEESASPRQKALLDKYGVRYPANITKDEASKLIEKTLNSRRRSR